MEKMRRSSQGSCNSNIYKYDFYNANFIAKSSHSHHKELAARDTKPRPTKWDDAQKWLSRAPVDDRPRRSSCADDRQLLPSPSLRNADCTGTSEHGDGETKRVDSMRTYRPRCVSLRDVGTEMTPHGSKEPSRASTPRAAAAAAAATPTAVGALHVQVLASPGQCESSGAPREAAGVRLAVSPATAWDEAKRAKYMARYRREEMKIQVWENRERRKQELQMKKTEVKAEKMKLRAQEKSASKMASMQRLVKEKRELVEAKLRQCDMRVSSKANYLKRRGHNGHLPCSFLSLKLPLFCH